MIRIAPNSIIVANQPNAQDKRIGPSLRVIADRCFVMRWYAIMLIMLCALNFFLFIWGIVTYSIGPDSLADWYLTLDIIANVLLAAKVVIRIIATHKSYWTHFWNKFDFTVMIISLVILLLYIITGVSAVIHRFLLALRYIAQVSRVYVSLRSLREQSVTVNAASTLEIDFTGLDTTEANKKKKKSNAKKNKDKEISVSANAMNDVNSVVLSVGANGTRTREESLTDYYPTQPAEVTLTNFNYVITAGLEQIEKEKQKQKELMKDMEVGGGMTNNSHGNSRRASKTADSATIDLARRASQEMNLSKAQELNL